MLMEMERCKHTDRVMNFIFILIKMIRISIPDPVSSLLKSHLDGVSLKAGDPQSRQVRSSGNTNQKILWLDTDLYPYLSISSDMIHI